MALLVYTDPKTGKEERLELDPKGQPVIIGRHESASLRIDNGSVSRRHCEIRGERGEFIIKDLGSSNGTKVNKKRLPNSSQQNLSDGDQIECGEVLIRFTAALEAKAGRKAPPRQELPSAPAPDPQQRTSPARESDALLDPAIADREISAPRRAKLTVVRPPDGAAAPDATAQPMPPSAAAEEGKKMRNDLDELSRRLRSAEQERDRLREGIAQTGKGRERELIARLREVEAERDASLRALEAERSQSGEAAVRMRELDERSVRYSMQLESVTEKYRQVREELDRLRQRLEQSREEGVSKDDRLDELERGRKIAVEENTALRQSLAESESRVREMKIRLTEKDRQIDQLQDQLAETEYELNELRGEVKRLTADYNRDGGELARAEQKANVLRDIIEDKENIIAQLRRELEEKDRENKQVRMGVGLADLEEERRKVLDDFYRKSREVDSLADQLSQQRREKEQLSARIAELEKKLEEADDDLLKQTESTRAIELQLKDTRRELATLTREKVRMEEQIAELDRALQARTAEDVQRATAELTDLRMQVEQLGEKLAQARAQAADGEHSAAQLGAIQQTVGGTLQVLEESVVSVRSNVSLLNTYVGDIRSVAQSASKLGSPEGAEELELAVDSFTALVDVVKDELAQLQQSLAAMRAAVDR